MLRRALQHHHIRHGTAQLVLWWGWGVHGSTAPQPGVPMRAVPVGWVLSLWSCSCSDAMGSNMGEALELQAELLCCVPAWTQIPHQGSHVHTCKPGSAPCNMQGSVGSAVEFSPDAHPEGSGKGAAPANLSTALRSQAGW